MTRPISPRVARALADNPGICTTCGTATLRGTVCEPCRERAAEADAVARRAQAEADTVSDRPTDDEWQEVARLVTAVKRDGRRRHGSR